ncbi:MAG: hypothetical protein QHH80_08375 [Anaerolineae bacterium]|nr:hypothetical protein [Anaerolineae bacterium]
MRRESDKTRVIKDLKVRKVHVYPRLWSLLPADLRARFSSQWEPVDRLARLLQEMPVGALQFLLDNPAGVFIISPAETGYVPGPVVVGKIKATNGVFVSAQALLDDEADVLRAIARLYDHLLGSMGAADGPRLSDGVGITPVWTEVGAQIGRLFALGHNPDPLCQRSPADYFAQSLALYITRPRDLNVADPNMHKLLQRTFFSETFWRRTRAEQ